MATFKPRLTKPEKGNKYYNTKANGGYSNAIKGKPTDKGCDVLSNCVGYAYGRFNEIGGWGCCKYLVPVNAENFIKYKGSLEVGQTPKLGACMVWRKGATLSGSDGAGHVAIVEKVISDTEVVVSESGYNSYAFRTKTRKKDTYGNWGAGSGYTFLGFIYNPAECCKDSEPTPDTTKPKPIYQVYAGGRWWGEITDYNTTNSNGYAGVFGKEISGIRVRLTNGKTVTVRSHISGRAKTNWLAEITKWDNTSNGYSGWKGKPTDCISMKADGCTLRYRVHVKGGGWLNWISEYDITDYRDGLAGAYGKPIDAVQITVE